MPLERCEPARHFYIAVPAYKGMMIADMGMSLAAACVALTVAGVGVTLAKQEGCPYLFHTRNALATAFMKSDATDLLFWDDDVGCPPEAAVRLARATRPFIVGIYPARLDEDETEFPVKFEVDEIWSDAEGYVEPSSVPTGFMRLNRGVFEAMPWVPYEDDVGRKFRGYFNSGIKGGRIGGEDTGFVAQWRAIGGKVHMIPDITFRHTGLKTWEANWGEWMKARLPKEAA